MNLRDAARDVLRGGDHEGPCTNDDDPWDSCELHVAIAAERMEALRAALDADDSLDAALAEAEAALNGRVLRVEYDPTVTDLPWMAEVLVGDYVAAHVDSDSPGAALRALASKLREQER